MTILISSRVLDPTSHYSQSNRDFFFMFKMRGLTFLVVLSLFPNTSALVVEQHSHGEVRQLAKGTPVAMMMMMMRKQMMMMGGAMRSSSKSSSSYKGSRSSSGKGASSGMAMMKTVMKMMMYGESSSSMMSSSTSKKSSKSSYGSKSSTSKESKGMGKGGMMMMGKGKGTMQEVELTPMSFQLDWRFNAQFAGVFLADYYGYFAEVGVAMEIRPWENGVNAVLDVAEAVADFACAEQNLIISAQADGAPVKAVSTMFQGSPYGLMAPIGTDLSSLEALRGQDVGVHIDGIKVMELVQGVNGIDDINVVEIPYADKWARVAAGEFYAVQCYVIDEPIGVAAIEGGVEPVVMRLADFGLLSTAQTIVVSDSTLDERGDLVKGVMSAIFKGWRDALADKEAAAKIIVDEYVPVDSSYYDVDYNLRILELLEPYVVSDGGIIGVIDPGKWAEAAELMLEYGIVSSLPDLETTLAVEYYIP